MDIEDLKPWLNKTQTANSAADLWPVHGLLAAIDSDSRPQVGAPAPHLAQWLYFAPTVPQSRIGADGHPERGDFLPPVALPRRMWAASDITYNRQIILGEELTKTASIADISMKQGSSGPLIFVKVANAYSDAQGAVIMEEIQTLVYRDQPQPGEASAPDKAAPADTEWSVQVTPNEAMLFRYSAVTFNAHRIHYDSAYARNVEHYPDIIVQGQLTATLLLNAFIKAYPEAAIKGFSFRGVRPIFCNETVFLEGARDKKSGGFKLWTRDAEGNLRTTAQVVLG